MTKITLYYDVVSPWARFAYYLLKRYQPFWSFELVLKPIFLGGVMVASGNQPPANIPNKGAYMNKLDLPLAAKQFGLSYAYPDKFPVNTLNIVRLLRVIREKESEATLEAVSEIFFEHQWGGAGVASAAALPANFAKIIPASVLSEDKLRDYMLLSQSTENKDAVKQEAVQLVAEGAFGFPWMVVERDDGEVYKFFGSDRFEQMAFWLNKPYEGSFPGSSRSHKAKL